MTIGNLNLYDIFDKEQEQRIIAAFRKGTMSIESVVQLIEINSEISKWGINISDKLKEAYSELIKE